jgi:hypothetical protein
MTALASCLPVAPKGALWPGWGSETPVRIAACRGPRRSPCGIPGASGPPGFPGRKAPVAAEIPGADRPSRAPCAAAGWRGVGLTRVKQLGNVRHSRILTYHVRAPFRAAARRCRRRNPATAVSPGARPLQRRWRRRRFPGWAHARTSPSAGRWCGPPPQPSPPRCAPLRPMSAMLPERTNTSTALGTPTSRVRRIVRRSRDQRPGRHWNRPCPILLSLPEPLPRPALRRRNLRIQGSP